MKTRLLVITLFLSAPLTADPIEDKLKPSEETKKETLLSKKREMLVITEAKLIPLIEFLGLPNVNKLPPTSAGVTKQIDVQMD
ncbi:MAG: hypothetical protein JKY88_04820 [Pseudomonadales bacterium]|nr:hypothetical protein [Pseudomonadales bacterium]